MIDRMTDRCNRICGSMDKPCFVNSQVQLRCISDMVVNKTTGISMTLGFSVFEEDREALMISVREAIAHSNELSNWIRYLQWIGDLKALSHLVLDSSANEKRKEIRYPMPSAASPVAIEVGGAEGGMSVGSLVNFSQSGLMVACGAVGDVSEGSQLDCAVMPSGVAMGGGMRVEFKAMLRYLGQAGEDGQRVLGMQVTEVMGSGVFNFFNEVYNIAQAHSADI